MRKLVVFVASIVCLRPIGVAAEGWSQGYKGLYGVSAVVRLGDGSLLAIGGHELAKIDPRSGRPIVARTLEADISPFRAVGSSAGAYTVGKFADGPEKLAAIGNDLHIRWMKSLPESLEWVIGPAPDGGVFLAGYQRGASPLFVIKLSRDGKPAWQTGLDVRSTFEAKAIASSSDGGCLVAGLLAGRPAFVRVDARGRLLWSRRLGLAAVPKGAWEVEGGDFVIAGYAHDPRAPFIDRIGADGAQRWLATGSRDEGDLEQVSRLGNGFFAATSGFEQEAVTVVVFDESGSVRSASTAPHASALRAGDGGAFLSLFDPSVHSSLVSAGDGRPGCLPMQDQELKFTRIRAVDAVLQPEASSETVDLEDVAPPGDTDARVTASECPRVAEARQQNEAPASPAQRDLDAANRDARTFVRDVQRMFLEQDFERLEELSDRVLREKREMQPMWWHIEELYRAIGPHAMGGQLSAAEQIALIEKWVARRPQSRTARTALVNAMWELVESAEKIGPGAAAGLDAATWRTRLRKAIDDARPFAGSDPTFISDTIAFAHLEQALFKIPVDLVAESRKGGALTSDPQPFFVAAAHAREGFDAPETYVQIAEAAATATATQYGDGVYATMAFNLLHEVSVDIDQIDGSAKSGLRLAAAGFSSERVEKGMRDLLARYPNWAVGYHRLARIAWIEGDRETAREMFLRPEVTADLAPIVWPAGQEFRAAKKWALAKATTVYDGPRSIPTSLISVRVNILDDQLNVIEKHDLNGFVIATSSGPAAVVTPVSHVGATPEETMARTSAVPRTSLRLELRAIDGSGTPVRPALQEDVAYGEPPAIRVQLVRSGSPLPPAKQLKIASIAAPAEPSRSAAVLVAARANGVVRQELVPVKVENPESSPFFLATPDRPVDLSTALGSPLVNDEGTVIGIVVGSKGNQLACQTTNILKIF